MRGWDILDFAWRAATGSPLRTLLMTLAMAIGVAAVVVLTALGDGARRSRPELAQNPTVFHDAYTRHRAEALPT